MGGIIVAQVKRGTSAGLLPNYPNRPSAQRGDGSLRRPGQALKIFSIAFPFANSSTNLSR